MAEINEELIDQFILYQEGRATKPQTIDGREALDTILFSLKHPLQRYLLWAESAQAGGKESNEPE